MNQIMESSKLCIFLLALLQGQSYFTLPAATAAFLPSSPPCLIKTRHPTCVGGVGISKKIRSHNVHDHVASSERREVSTLFFGKDDKDEDEDDNHISTRRNVVKTIASLTPVSYILTSLTQQSVASTTTSTSTSNVSTTSSSLSTTFTQNELKPNFNCLSNLPPIPPDHVRIYLCRHGQTEYNRLKLIQGARTDAPLNDTGMKQATRLGKVLSHLRDKLVDQRQQQQQTLKAGMHSNLLRAKETASIAALTFSILQKNLLNNNNGDIHDGVLRGDDEILKFVNDMLVTSKMTKEQSDDLIIPSNNDATGIQLQSLSTLGEVDFGPLNEGKSTTLAKADMLKIYSEWALGNIDAKMGGGGESGRDVLTRAASALDSLTTLAANNGGSAIAVSHSTYIRMMIALVMDMRLTQAATLEQKNCCVNVFDISLKDVRRVDAKSNLFQISALVPQNFNLSVPAVSVVRINEINHLVGLS